MPYSNKDLLKQCLLHRLDSNNDRWSKTLSKQRFTNVVTHCHKDWHSSWRQDIQKWRSRKRNSKHHCCVKYVYTKDCEVIPHAVVGEFVVGRKSDKRPVANAQGIEDLHCCFRPHLYLRQAGHVWLHDVILQALVCALQGESCHGLNMSKCHRYRQLTVA